jgi:hypothetical protein
MAVLMATDNSQNADSLSQQIMDGRSRSIQGMKESTVVHCPIKLNGE